MKNNRLQMALRRNRGKQVFPRFLLDVTKSLRASEDSIILLDLEKSDEFWATFEIKWNYYSKHPSECYQKSYSPNEIYELIDVITILNDQAPDGAMILYRDLSEYCGAVIISSRRLFDALLRLLNLDMDELREAGEAGLEGYLVSLDQSDLTAASEDVSKGIVLTYNMEVVGGNDSPIFELLIWGEEWVNIIPK